MKDRGCSKAEISGQVLIISISLRSIYVSSEPIVIGRTSDKSHEPNSTPKTTCNVRQQLRFDVLYRG